MPTKKPSKGLIALYIIGGVAVLAIGARIAGVFDKAKPPEPPPKEPLPNNGSGIPENWSAKPDAIRLYTAMDGWGTDYDAIKDALKTKSNDQLVAIYNEFNRLYFLEGDGDLFEWFSDDLSGDDLDEVLSYFSETNL